LEADFLKQQCIKPLIAHMSVFHHRDNMQSGWNFRENSQIWVVFFKAPAKKPKQISIFHATRALRHFIAIK